MYLRIKRNIGEKNEIFYIYDNREVHVEVVELVKVEATESAVEEVHEVLGHPRVLVDVVPVSAVRNTREAKDDNNEHHGKHEEMDRTIEDGRPQDDNVTHKGKPIEDEKNTKE